MTLNTIKAGITGLTPDAFTDLSRWFYQEGDRRRAAAHADKGRAEVIGDLRDEGVITSPTGDPDNPQGWENPGTNHTLMYIQGDVVTHKGRVWRSEHRGLNSWEPGAPGVDARIWHDITPEEEDPDGVIDFRAGVAVEPGDIVRYAGELYQVLQAHTMADHWPPPEVAAMYSKV